MFQTSLTLSQDLKVWLELAKDYEVGAATGQQRLRFETEML